MLLMSRCWILPLIFATAPPLLAEEKLEFNRDIRPILSDKCFHCHGPDSQTREAGLRLDTREGALEGLAINLKQPAESELLIRVLSHDDDEVMPPTESKLGRLTDEETDKLKRWIDQGAAYQLHWSFEPLNHHSPRLDMDSIVSAKLKSRDLEFQPEADRYTLIRRLSFDLTGLPPTPQEVEAFVNDLSTDAYAKLVDRLLASPHYGERMAVDWLDVARYADSYGFQVDKMREVWPWRDWVIEAFNKNLPYDQFITWQVAGDMLPNATNEQILATAFNRLHQQESEGGSVEEEYRMEYVTDRLHTFGTAFLGLTFECSRCHDHKYDPISQKEYYQMTAFFQNIDEAGLYSYFTDSTPTPTLSLNNPTSRDQLNAAVKKVHVLEQQAARLKDQLKEKFLAWSKDREGEISVTGEAAYFTFDAKEDGNRLPSVDAKHHAVMKGGNQLVQGQQGNAIKFTGDDPVELPLGNYPRTQPFSISLWLNSPKAFERAVVFHRSRAWTDAASRGYELLIEDGRLKWSLIHFWPGNAISVKTKATVPLNSWQAVTVTYDGSSKAKGLKVYINGKHAETEVVRDALTREITGGGGDNIALGERFRDRGFKDGMIDEFRVYERTLSSSEAAALNKADVPRDETSEFEFYLAMVSQEWSAYLIELRKAREECARVVEAMPEVMVMRELPQPKPAYILFRGEYSQRREEVKAATPAVLPPLPPGAKANRLGLAQWLTDPKHPLTARVTVNRLWQSLFGRGLVKTTEDFGSQGERPVYQDLLDALAIEFIRNGWDVKALLKTIVMSRTYRQQSLGTQQMMMDDPDNEWLSRGPRFRLPAEMIRDNALAASGLMEDRLGGPSVNPYEMSEAFKPVKVQKDSGLYRRSLYTTWRRTAPPPAMIAFDAPRRAVCSVKRERTDSPLQALILLNGTQFVEAARVMGTAAWQSSKGDYQKMIHDIFMRSLSRPPDEREVSISSQLFEEQFEYFKAHPDDATALMHTGHASMDVGLKENLPELAAATALAQALLNHDGSVVKR